MAQPEACTCSDQAVGTTTVIAHPALLWGATVNAGSATATLVIYDNASAGSGTVIGRCTAAANNQGQLVLLSPVDCLNGITVVIAGTGATAQTYFTRSH